MPRKKKSKLEKEVVEKEDSDDEQEKEGDSDSSISTEMVQADFEAFAPSENDLGGVSSLLQQLLLKAPISINELAKIIVESDIGCVHKVASDDEEANQDDDTMETDDDQDVYGVVTIVDVTSDDKECIGQLRTALRKRYGESGSANSKPEFDRLWKPDKSKRIGWIINERLVNIPFQIAVPSFEALMEELDGSSTKYDRFMAILKIHKLQGDAAEAGASAGGGAGGGKKGSAKKRHKGKKAPNSDPIIFANAEEEILFEECESSFDYCVSNETEGGILGDRRGEDGSYKPYRRVIIFDRAAFNRFLTKLKSIESD